MTRFLITYYAGRMPSDPDSIASARCAFMRWAEQAGPALAEAGAPIRSATTIGAGSATGAADREPLMGWSVIEVTDRDAAIRLMRDHPFIALGGTLLINEPV
jgi:hypothetical protein